MSESAGRLCKLSLDDLHATVGAARPAQGRADYCYDITMTVVPVLPITATVGPPVNPLAVNPLAVNPRAIA